MIIETAIKYLLEAVLPAAHAAASAPEAAHGSVTALLGINWKLFIAQLINFGVVLLILWKFLFGPLGAKLEQRSKKIEESLRKAKEIEEMHAKTEQQRVSDLTFARQEAAEIILKARETAEHNKSEIINEVVRQSKKILDQQKKMIEEEKIKMLAEIREEAAGLIIAGAEKILRAKIDPKQDKEIIEQTIKQL